VKPVISSHLNPDNGKPIPENKKSEVRFYKCGPLFVLHDENPDKILKKSQQIILGHRIF
jgi:hypothetical protein